MQGGAAIICEACPVFKKNGYAKNNRLAETC